MATTNGERPSPELSSWKEIAEYLGTTVRTAQRWEREQGLPVHRAPGERGRVVGNRAELDEWKKVTFTRPRLWNDIRLVRSYAIVVTAILVLAAAAAAGYALVSRPRSPVDFTYKNHVLTALDGTGSVVWRNVFAEPARENLYDLGSSRENWTWMGDLAPDHPSELVFGHFMASINAPWPVLCFSRNGLLRWRFSTEKKVRDTRQEFLPPYHLRGIRVFPSPQRDGSKWIAVSSAHHYDYPCQIGVLDANGALLKEYWHSGHLDTLESGDLDGDEFHELMLGGVNQGRRQAEFVILDPRVMSGASTQPAGDPHQLQGFSAGTEKAVVLFPRTLLNEKLDEFNMVKTISLQKDSIEVYVQERAHTPHGGFVIYKLDRNLKVVRIVPSVSLKTEYRENGSELGEAEIERLRNGVQVIRR